MIVSDKYIKKNTGKKIAVILGTRPEIIKLSMIIKELHSRKSNFFIIHTNQHYDPKMDKVFFDNFGIPEQKYNLNITKNTTHAKQLSEMISGIDVILKDENPDCVIVQGDTNTVLAGAMVAQRNRIKVVHVEAGLRSYDKTMPEEVNRIFADNISDLLCCPTYNSLVNLKKENIYNNCYLTGNTIVDAVKFAINNRKGIEATNIITKNRIRKYSLLTLHRQSNLESIENLENIMKGLELIQEKIIFPIHPKTKDVINRYQISIPKNVIVCDPLDYFGFLTIQNHANIIITDSGGVQEEACILNVPCVTLRENTERQETIEIGSNILCAELFPQKILEAWESANELVREWPNPFGDGQSSKKIVDLIYEKI